MTDEQKPAPPLAETIAATAQAMPAQGGRLKRAVDEVAMLVTILGERSQSASAMLIAAACDEQLRERLLDKMVGINREMKDALFKNYGPLSGFKAKIDICFALGLIEREHWKKLDVVRSIRNKFAHNSTQTHFTDDAIIDKLKTVLPEGEELGNPEDFYAKIAQSVEAYNREKLGNMPEAEVQH